jgi:pseudaminic acid biosynthesis-associated methylase
LSAQRAAKTGQIERWTSEFGREYTDRNLLTTDELNSLWKNNYGVTREQLNERFLSGVPRNARILEVGCNVGNQLLMLQRMGFQSLYGVEVQGYATEGASRRLPGAQITQATAFDIPYPGDYFDLVFTSGVLIHIAPDDLLRAAKEIHRCARTYIWGLEYHSPDIVEIDYRGEESLLWKMDYPAFYLKNFADLELVQLEHLPYLGSTNVDCMFLLRKKNVA